MDLNCFCYGSKVAVSIAGCGDFMPFHQALELAFRYAANTAMGRALANAEETARKQALATATEKAPGCRKCCLTVRGRFFLLGRCCCCSDVEDG